MVSRRRRDTVTVLQRAMILAAVSALVVYLLYIYPLSSSKVDKGYVERVVKQYVSPTTKSNIIIKPISRNTTNVMDLSGVIQVFKKVCIDLLPYNERPKWKKYARNFVYALAYAWRIRRIRI